MKTLDLAKLGVQEMNSHEVKKIEGGSILVLLGGVALGYAIWKGIERVFGTQEA